jgi:hypothetical protein
MFSVLCTPHITMSDTTVAYSRPIDVTWKVAQLRDLANVLELDLKKKKKGNLNKATLIEIIQKHLDENKAELSVQDRFCGLFDSGEPARALSNIVRLTSISHLQEALIRSRKKLTVREGMEKKFESK